MLCIVLRRNWAGGSMKAVIVLSIVTFAGLCGVALADTRSDVLERLARCNTFPDGRTWLDCYYAAAQPERTELGLPPAPQAPNYEALFRRPAAPPALAPPAMAPAAR